jgi:hypothetical protein
LSANIEAALITPARYAKAQHSKYRFRLEVLSEIGNQSSERRFGEVMICRGPSVMMSSKEQLSAEEVD